MKRIWFVQQQPFDFMPLRAGLKMIPKCALQVYQDHMNSNPLTAVGDLCPKIYTTRTRRMSGEYQVVRGSRFKAKPLDPSIQFKVEKSYEIDFTSNLLIVGGSARHVSCLDVGKHSASELDLGIKGTTMEALHEELLKLNKKATIDTPFYINKLEPIN